MNDTPHPLSPPHRTPPARPSHDVPPAVETVTADSLNDAEWNKIRSAHPVNPAVPPLVAGDEQSRGEQSRGEQSRGEIALTQAADTRLHELREAEHRHAHHHHFDLAKDARTVASVLSVVPGPGTLAAIAIDGATTAIEGGVDLAQGKSPGDVAQHFGRGLLSTGLDVIPVGGGVLAKATMGLGGVAGGGFCQVGSDAVAMVGGPNIKCHDYVSEGLNEVAHRITGGHEVADTGGMPDRAPAARPNPAVVDVSYRK